MEPKSISATAIAGFEGCEAGYHAQFIQRAPDMQGEHAALGSAAHEALEIFVRDGHYLMHPEFKILKTIFFSVYYKYFEDDSKLAEGEKMLKNWFDRNQYWDDREVLSTEVKENFELKFSLADGTKLMVPVTYIWDRCDRRLDDGSIDVVDYKSFGQPMSPDAMRSKIQVRVYGLAAQIKYPDATRIRVSYDLLRYDKIGVVLSRDDNIATYRYLQAVARRIWESDGTQERLNPACRWCVRKSDCDTLLRHEQAGGIMSVKTKEAAADMRALIDYRMSALRALRQELDDYLMDEMERDNILDFKTELTKVKVTARGQRKAESELIAKIVGPDIMAHYGHLNLGDIDAILKTEELTDEQKSQIKQLITKEYGNPYIVTEPAHPLEED